MVFINTEGKFNDNTYLIDGNLFRLEGTLSVYVIENNGMRMMVDTSSNLAARKIVKKLKEFEIFPIHKILLTHSHWDHMQSVGKLKNLMKETTIEVLASENAINNLKNPGIMNDVFEYGTTDPVEDVTPLKEGDIIDLNGLKLEVLNFFGHTMDSIAIFDKKNKNIFVGDAIIDRLSDDTFQPTFMPPEFNESEILKTFQKLRDMKEKLNSISLAHYGVWTDEDFERILNEMEELHFKPKDSIIKWYNENPSFEYIASKFHETFIPNSKMHTKENMIGLELQIDWLLKGLKMSGFIK
ncbi:MAG: MBL fold metallo-hydrolase [Promethearchaeota archaeon]